MNELFLLHKSDNNTLRNRLHVYKKVLGDVYHVDIYLPTSGRVAHLICNVNLQFVHTKITLLSLFSPQVLQVSKDLIARKKGCW